MKWFALLFLAGIGLVIWFREAENEGESPWVWFGMIGVLMFSIGWIGFCITAGKWFLLKWLG